MGGRDQTDHIYTQFFWVPGKGVASRVRLGMKRRKKWRESTKREKDVKLVSLGIFFPIKYVFSL